jgi:hypothetical protein
MAKASERLKSLAKEIANLPANDFDFLLTQIPEQIKKRTQLGKGVPSEGASNTALEKLSPNYVKARKKFPLPAGITPKKSGLSLTGHMLSSIIGVRNGFSFSFFFSDSFADKKARWAADGSDNRPKRRFFDLSKSERLGIKRDIKNIIRERIRSIFK